MRRWRNPFAGTDGRARRATYLALALVLLGYAAAFALTGEARLFRAAPLAVVGLFELIGSRHIRPLVYYHPAYKVEKGAAAVMFIGLAGQVTLGITGVTAITVAWIGLAVASRIAALEFILFRNRAPGRRLLHTTQGVVPVPTGEEADAILDLAASYRRHEYGSRAMREQYDEAAGVDPQTETARRLREQLASLRAAVARGETITDARRRAAAAAELEMEDLGAGDGAA